MARVPKVLHDYINSAYPDYVCLVSTVLDNGYAQVSPRGSIMVYDDETLGMWLRGGGSTAAGLEDGTKVTVFYRNPTIRQYLPRGGIARFYGTAEIHKTDPVREKVWTGMIEQERKGDPDKKGYAALIRIERAEDLFREPLDLD